MACVINYKNNTYSLEDFKNVLLQDNSLLKEITKKSQERLNAIQEIFNQNSELSKIGDVFSYASYLDSIYPDSKVKDIVYHGTEQSFEEFNTDIISNGRTKGDGVYFTDNKAAAERLAGISDLDREMLTAKEISNYVKPAIVNSNNPIEDNEVVVQPEQIHILGNKQDIEGFKEFVNKKETAYPTTIFSNIYELIPNITDKKIDEIYNNYVSLMNRQREGKAVKKESFLSLMKTYQVLNYKNTYIFGQYDVNTGTFITRLNSSPTSKELLAEAIPNIVSNNIDFISFVPKDYADKLVRSGYTSSSASYAYDFKGEMMQKYAVASNPSVFKKIFNKEFNQITPEEIKKYSNSVELKYKPVEINANLIVEAGRQAPKILETYLKQFGIIVKDINEMKDQLNIDEVGFADILSKIAYVKDKKDLPPIAGEFIAYMMQYNNLVQDIINNLSETENYKNLDKSQYFKIIGKLISEDLQNKLEGNYNKSLVYKIKELVRKFFDLFKNVPIDKINTNIGIITNNILQQNKKLITSSLYKPGAYGKETKKVSIEDALAKDKFGASVIYKLAKQGFILTGSTALSEQGTILRPDENPLHDIDWVSPFVRKLTEQKFMESYPDAIKVRDIYTNDYVTDSYLIAPEDYQIKNYQATNYNGKIIIQSYDVVNNKGEVVGTYNLQKQQDTNQLEEVVTGIEAKVIDFFSYENPETADKNAPFPYSSTQGTVIQLANWKDIFNAKLNFARYKDIWDYNRFIPYQNLKQQVQETSPLLQLEEGPKSSKASTQTLNKIKELAKKIGVSIQSLSEYAKNNPDVKTSSINGLADLVKSIVAIADGKEDVALTEEMVHIATAMIEQTNPTLITEAISKIDRFKIYKKTLDAYKDNKHYQLPNGKPDIRKIKKEAVDKLIVEVIINKSEGSTEFPELMQEENVSAVRKLWNRIIDKIFSKVKGSNINIFEQIGETVLEGNIEGLAKDKGLTGIYLQTVSDKQKAVQERLLIDQDRITKVVETASVDPMFLDSEDASNFYNMKNTSGVDERVVKRVTDRVKAWYKKKFGTKVFSEAEKKYNNMLRDYGVKGHNDLEEIHSRFFHKDGVQKTTASPRPSKFNVESEDIYLKLEEYYIDLIKLLKEQNNGVVPLVFSEVKVYDPKEKEAGTIDFLAIDSNGKGHILDWKFMNIKGDDVAWYKNGAFDIQLGRYKQMLRDVYGIKEFGMIRAIPISMEFTLSNPRDVKSDLKLKGIGIGSADSRKIEDIKLMPISEKTESTGYSKLDKLISNMNALMSSYSKKEVTSEDDKQFKIETLEVLRKAIKVAQATNNLVPIIDVIEKIRIEGEKLLNDYNSKYKNLSPTDTSVSRSEINDFSERMRLFYNASNIFTETGRQLSQLIYEEGMLEKAVSPEEKKNAKDRKELADTLKKQSQDIANMRDDIRDESIVFADKQIGIRNLITGLPSAEAVLKGLGAFFRGASDLPNAAIRVLVKLTSSAKEIAAKESFDEVEELMKIRKKIVDRGGDVRSFVKKIYRKNEKNEVVNKLISKHSPEFYSVIDELAAKGGDREKLLNNIDIDVYRKKAKEVIDKQVKKIMEERWSYDDAKDSKEKQKRVEAVEKLYDIDNPNFYGWNNWIVKGSPANKWISKEYLEIQADEDLKALYEFIIKINTKAKDVGYINTAASSFLPFIRKGMAEALAWDSPLSAIQKWNDSLTLRPGDVGYGEYDEFSGKLENSIPKYYTYDFTRNDEGVNNFSEVSEDIFKNMIVYLQQVNKYKHLSEVEEQLRLVREIEEFKGHIQTDRFGNVVIENGKPKVIDVENSENTKLYENFLKVLLYEQKYPLSDSDIPLNVGKVLNGVKDAINSLVGKEVFKKDENPKATSLMKVMESANRAFQVKTLALEIVPGASNFFGGVVQILTQSGAYFNKNELRKNLGKSLKQKFESEADKEMFVQLINTFMPLKDSPIYEMFKKAGMSSLTRDNLGDKLMITMRFPEQVLEESVFLSLLDNAMIENGEIVNIQDYVKAKYPNRSNSSTEWKAANEAIKKEVELLKETRSITATKKLVNGKLEIPGLDLTNLLEIQRLTTLTKRTVSNALGGVSGENVNLAGMNLWTSSMMLFHNWIPKLTDTRFSEFKRVSDDFNVRINDDGVSEGDRYDVGRIRLLLTVLGTSIRDRSANVSNIIAMNDKGIETINELFEKYRKEYEDRTGQVLNMTKDDFVDLVRKNLRNQLKELLTLAILLGIMFSFGFIAPDDDDDKASKNAFRLAQKVINKFTDELSFFYNPMNYEKLFSGSMFPALGLISDFERFITNFILEVTGIDANLDTSSEQVRKKAQPIKYLMKMFPVSKAAFTWLSVLNSDFAEEFDVTIQKENTIR